MKVVVTDYTFPALAQEEAAARAAGADFAAFQCKTPEAVAEAVAGADVAVVQFAGFGPAAVAAVKPGATVIRYGVGYDNIDMAAARAAAICRQLTCCGGMPSAWCWPSPRLHRA